MAAATDALAGGESLHNKKSYCFGSSHNLDMTPEWQNTVTFAVQIALWPEPGC
jgi:hypothetical protein